MENKFYFLKDEFEGKAPYYGDAFTNREQFAGNLIKIIEAVGDGAVISIDAQWGDGKTTFVKWFKDDLKTKGYVTIYFDAFKHDFQSDAFSAIFPALSKLFEENRSVWDSFVSKSGKNLVDLFTNIFKKTAPVVAGGLAAIGTGDPLYAQAVGETAKAATDAIMSEKSSVPLNEQLDNLKIELEEFTTTILEKENGKPFVFIIDELDRCRPIFAVEVLEKIKHFFSVPGIIWILAINKEQLSESIKHVYGSSEPHLYFEKFFNIQTTLPKGPAGEHNGGKAIIRGHHVQFFNKCNVVEDLTSNDYVGIRDYIGILYANYKFSLRDIRQHCFYINLLSKYDLDDPLLYLLPALYIKKPALYQQIWSNQFEPEELLETFSWLFQYTEHNVITTHLCGIVYCISLKTNENRKRIINELETNNFSKDDKWKNETLKYVKFLRAFPSSSTARLSGTILKTSQFTSTINSFSLGANL